MGLTKKLTATAAVFGLFASSMAIAAKPVAPAKTDGVRAAASAKDASKLNDEETGSEAWIIALLALLAAIAGIIAATSGDDDPESP